MNKHKGRPSKACDVCKRQKIRCSADRPSCTRCARLKSSCQYNNNGIKKRIAVAGRIRKTTKGLLPNLSEPSGSATGTATLETLNDNCSDIPPSLINILVELYFKKIYQSSLLLHKATFIKSLANSTVRPHVLLSMCALAANFQQDEDDRSKHIHRSHVEKWARKATSLVFEDSQDFYPDNIVTFFNLALFWHSQGSWRMSFLHKGNACQQLHIIGTSGKNNPDLNSEMHRRRFWACYLMHCFSSEKLFRFEAIADIEHLLLPWPDRNFETNTPPTAAATIANGVVTGSEFAELIRGLHLWSRVSSAVRCRQTSISSRIQQIFDIESNICTWWSSVPLHFKLGASAIPNAHHESISKILLTNFVYHQSLCALHSSIVPLFSWSKGDTYQSSARQLSAQTAFEHAGAISILARCILKSTHSMSSMPIFVAYAAYSSCAIQIPFLWCSKPDVKAQARSNVEANANIIQRMSSYWKLASLLKVYVRCIHDVHKANPPNISNEPRYADFSAFSHFVADSDIAKTSIIEFTGILRSSGGGYLKPGEERRDLLSIKAPADFSAQMSLSSNANLDEMVQDTQDISTMAASDSHITDLSVFSNEWPALDVINSLMDVDLVSAFAMDNYTDLTGFETDFLTWDMLDSI